MYTCFTFCILSPNFGFIDFVKSVLNSHYECTHEFPSAIMVSHGLFLLSHSIIPTVYVRTHNETNNNTCTRCCLDVGIMFKHKHDLKINQTLVNDLSLGVLGLIYISTVTAVCSTKTVLPQVKTLFILFHKTVG